VQKKPNAKIMTGKDSVKLIELQARKKKLQAQAQAAI
jgi:hypothetical protein